MGRALPAGRWQPAGAGPGAASALCAGARTRAHALTAARLPFPALPRWRAPSQDAEETAPPKLLVKVHRSDLATDLSNAAVEICTEGVRRHASSFRDGAAYIKKVRAHCGAGRVKGRAVPKGDGLPGAAMPCHATPAPFALTAHAACPPGNGQEVFGPALIELVQRRRRRVARHRREQLRRVRQPRDARLHPRTGGYHALHRLQVQGLALRHTIKRRHEAAAASPARVSAWATL